MTPVSIRSRCTNALGTIGTTSLSRVLEQLIELRITDIINSFDIQAYEATLAEFAFAGRDQRQINS